MGRLCSTVSVSLRPQDQTCLTDPIVQLPLHLAAADLHDGFLFLNDLPLQTGPTYSTRMIGIFDPISPETSWAVVDPIEFAGYAESRE